MHNFKVGDRVLNKERGPGTIKEIDGNKFLIKFDNENKVIIHYFAKDPFNNSYNLSYEFKHGDRVKTIVTEGAEKGDTATVKHVELDSVLDLWYLHVKWDRITGHTRGDGGYSPGNFQYLEDRIEVNNQKKPLSIHLCHDKSIWDLVKE